MAELLVLAKAGYANPDPDYDRSGCYKKGDIVFVADDGHIWGGKEGPPDFVIVKIPGPTRAQAENYRDEWSVDLQYNIDSSDPATDTFNVTLSAELPGTANQAGVTRAKVEAYLNGWGIIVTGAAQNAVSFTARIFDVLTSPSFWDRDISGLTFNELSYDQSAGLHTIQVDLLTLKAAQRGAAAVISKGGNIVSIVASVLTFTMDRSVARAAFQADVAANAKEVFKRRRWAFPASDVDTALSSGGIVTITLAQAQARLIDATAV